MYHKITMKLEEILKLAVEKSASDVHLKAGMTPIIRRHGSLRPLATEIAPLTGEGIEEMAISILNEEQKVHYAQFKEVDVGYGVPGVGRFRISIFKQRGTTRMVLRHIPHKVPNLKDLKLPALLDKMVKVERGLILVTGATGSGKSSTLAAMVDAINHHENKHILTIEDPIEFLIRDRKSLITQREIGIDTPSFAKALRAGLRQDPDVILIGEMRDRETVEIAMQAAETGHLVYSTLHTVDTTETINRILSFFDAESQKQIRLQLGATLKAVISQRLCTRKDGSGYVPAVEIMISTPRIREMIEKPEATQDILNAIEEGAQAYGMQSFDQSLMSLLQADLISYPEALSHCARPEDFKVRYEGITSLDGKKWGNDSGFNNNMKDRWHEMSEVEIVIPTKASQNVKNDEEEDITVVREVKRKK